MSEEFDRNLKSIAKASVIVFVSLALSKILVYGYRIVVARFFGPEVYGLFSLSLMISGWFIAISLLGLYEGILRYIPIYRGKRETEKIKFVFGVVTKVQVISGILAGLALFFLADFIAIEFFDSPNLIPFLKVFSFVATLSVIANPFITVLRAYEKIGWYSFISSVSHNILKVALIVLFIVLGFNSTAVGLSFLIGTIGMGILAYFVAKYKLPQIFSKDSLKEDERGKIAKEVFSYSIPLLFSSFLFSIFHWVDSFSIGYFKGATEVGFYNAAIPIALLLTLAPEFFMKLFYPIINKEYSKKNVEVIKELSKQVGKWIFIINLPLFLILFILPGEVLNFLFGAEYTVASQALRLLSISSFIVSFTGVISHKLVSMVGKSKLVLFNVVTVLILNIVLNSFLVPMEKIFFLDNALGINGAAIATVISMLVLVLLFSIESKYYLSILPLRRKMLLILLASVVPAVSLYYLSEAVLMNFFTLMLLSSFFILFYVALILLTRGLDKNDMLIISSVKKKLLTKGAKKVSS